MSSLIPPDDAGAVRAALVSHLTRKLAPLYRSGQLRAELAEWLAPLTTLAIVRAFKGTPEETAEALAVALIHDSAKRHPQDAIADVIALEHPKMAAGERSLLIGFTEAVRLLAQENDGAVTERDLFAKGYGLATSKRLIGTATQILAIIDGHAQPRRRVDTHSADRLLEAGVRSSARNFPAAALSA